MADTGNKWKKVMLIIIAVLVVLMILVFIFVGFKGLKDFFTWLVIGILILAILFGLMYVFYIIFIKKEFKDIPASFRKKLVMTTKVMKQELLGDLWLSGDTKHNRINLGGYRYMRIMLPKQVRKVMTDKEGNPQVDEFNQPKIEEFTHEVPIDCFIIMKKGVMAKMFEDPKVILTKPQDHNYSSIFNDVTLNGFNLVPLDNQFYTLDHRNLDTDLTKGITTNYMKEVVYEIFSDLDRLVKQAIDLDASHQKDKERQLEFDVPRIGGGGNN